MDAPTHGQPGIPRSLLRWIHIVFGLPLLGYIYGPPEEVQQYAPFFRLVFVPVLVLSGFWMWKGHLVTRLIAKNRPHPTPQEKGNLDERR